MPIEVASRCAPRLKRGDRRTPQAPHRGAFDCVPKAHCKMHGIIFDTEFSSNAYIDLSTFPPRSSFFFLLLQHSILIMWSVSASTVQGSSSTPMHIAKNLGFTRQRIRPASTVINNNWGPFFFFVFSHHKRGSWPLKEYDEDMNFRLQDVKLEVGRFEYSIFYSI